MNKIDVLLKLPFSSLSLQEKLHIRSLGAHQPKDFKLEQSGKHQNRSFSTSWFDRKSWLSVSEEKKSLFCFVYVLFGGDKSWTLSDINDLKHLSERVKKHETSSLHIDNDVKLKLLGFVNVLSQLSEGYRSSIERHNKLVDKNRHVLDRIINCLKFCGTHELPLRGHDESQSSHNRGVFLDLVSELAHLDSILDDHLRTATVSKYTSKTIQNELLECMYEVYIQTLKDEIKTVKFVSVQADETTDNACMSQFVILLQYVKGSDPVERFLSFVHVQDRTADGLVLVLKKELEPYHIEKKLIAQSYDGAAVMSGGKNGVQAKMREVFPYAHYIHCYAHQLNLVVKKACFSVTSIRLFFSKLSGFSSFFSVSAKRTDLLKSVCGRSVPKSVETRWNSQSRIVANVYENKDSLLKCFDEIQEDPIWDEISIRESDGLSRLLNDEQFNFFLSFFNSIFYHINILYNTLQKTTTNPATLGKAIEHFQTAIQDIRDNLQQPEVPAAKRARNESTTMIANAKEACDIIVVQMKERFKGAIHTLPFSLVEPRFFAEYSGKFPTEFASAIIKHFPMLQEEKLKNELLVLYKNNTFAEVQTVTGLYNLIRENNLENTLTEVTKLVNIVLTSPVSTAESERCFSTLKRVKTCLRNSMRQERLNALAVLSIHKEVIVNIPLFNKRVIELFASQKERRGLFLYK